jgi:2-keto-3-deoxy-L-fuconate dehydrogenase
MGPPPLFISFRNHQPSDEAGLMKEEQTQQSVGEVGSPHDVAALALFLCSSEASYITGTNYGIETGKRKMIYW